MSIEKNKYYKLSSVGFDALAAGESILKQYPLTRIFLEILGRYFLNQLQFAIFTPGTKIIQQGERGKDLFLICGHSIDVTVNQKMIVRMDAPALIGDKGIVDKHSIRNATISVSEGGDCLLLRMPMELFIRSFKKKEIKDAEFSQERLIYHHLFLEIQERLFRYADIQKSLWDEIATRIHSLNNQLIRGYFVRKEIKDWGPDVWNPVVDHLQKTLRVPWPKNAAVNFDSLFNVVRKNLDETFHRSSFKGSDQAYNIKKDAILQNRLDELSKVVVKALPESEVPISIGEIELFNPRVYQMRINRLLRSIDKNLRSRGIDLNPEFKNSAVLSVTRFFGRNPKIKGFNLEAYLLEMEKMFALKSPNRVLAQIAQQVAQLGAACENEFNASVSKMRHFLDKVRKISAIETDKPEKESHQRKLLQYTMDLNKGFIAYFKGVMGQSSTSLRNLSFSETSHPTITELVKSGATNQFRQSVKDAFTGILETLEIQMDGYSSDKTNELFHLCEIEPEDYIRSTEIARHKWILVSPKTILESELSSFEGMRPGHLIGGNAWDDSDDSADEKPTWRLTMAGKKDPQKPHQKCLILIIPDNHLPWSKDTEPRHDEFMKNHFPLLQWMLKRLIKQIDVMGKLRDILVDRYIKVSEVVVTERKVREFEDSGGVLTPQKREEIIDLVIDEVGIKLDKNAAQTSARLSKQLYNAILKQIKSDFQDLSIEEQGNKAYTLWRFTQSEIVTRIFSKETLEKIKTDVPPSTSSILMGHLEPILRKISVDINHPGIQLTDTNPMMDLKSVLMANKSILTPQRLKTSLDILEVAENMYRLLIDETNAYQKRLEKFSNVETEFNVGDIQTKFVMDSVSKLRQILDKRIAS